jgi:2,5-diamino-6-(ribosylamino)-4(3H)-pyrimidinone 5'-phosphate reductase
VVILISDATPKDYIQYLKERNYDYHTVGEEHIDLPTTLKLLTTNYNVKTILADTGKILGNLLLNQGLISEISLLIHPVIVGENAYPIFSLIHANINLKLIEHEILDDGYTWLVYEVSR